MKGFGWTEERHPGRTVRGLYRCIATEELQRLAGFALALLLTASLPARARAASLDALAWMTGSWSGTSGNLRIEEHWTMADGGMMTAMHRDLRGGKVVSFEFLRI